MNDRFTEGCSYIDEKEVLEKIRRIPSAYRKYQEMFAYRQKPEEVLGMFSEALRQLDKNTVQYMIEEQQKVIEEQKQNLVEKDKRIAEKEQEIARLKQLLR